MEKELILKFIKATNLYYGIVGESLVDAYSFYRDIKDSAKIMAEWLIRNDFADSRIEKGLRSGRHAMDMIWDIVNDNPECVWADEILGTNDLLDSEDFDEDSMYYEDNMTMLISLMIAEENPVFMNSLKTDLYNRLKELKDVVDNDEANEYISLMEEILKEL